MTIEYEPQIGEDLENACWRATMISSLHKKDVAFDFNGVHIVVTPESTVENLVKSFHDQLRAERDAYELTPEYKEQERERQLRTAQLQGEMDALWREYRTEVACLPEPQVLLLWFSKWIPLQDNVGIKSHIDELCAHLILCGNVASQFTGLTEQIYEEPRILCKYVIGQVLSMNAACGVVHPWLGSICVQETANGEENGNRRLR